MAEAQFHVRSMVVDSCLGPRDPLVGRPILESLHTSSKTMPSIGAGLRAPSSAGHADALEEIKVKSTVREKQSWHQSPPADASKQDLYEYASHDPDDNPYSSPPYDAEIPIIGAAGGGLHGYYLPLNGAAPNQTGGSRRSRPLTAHQQAMVASRRERVEYLLDRNLRAQQKAHQRERARRGIVVDSWIKTSELVDEYGDLAWDSERDGVDSAVGGVTDVLRHVTGDDDAGDRARTLARAFRRIARVLDDVRIGDPARRKRRRRIEEPNDIIADDGLFPSAASGPAPHEDTDTPRVKRVYKRRPGGRASGLGPGNDTVAAKPAALRRGGRAGQPSSRTAQTSANGTSHLHIDRRRKYDTGSPATPRARSPARRGSARTLARDGAIAVAPAEPDVGAVEDEEIDELDRELLGEVGGEEEAGEGPLEDPGTIEDRHMRGVADADDANDEDDDRDARRVGVGGNSRASIQSA